MNQNQKTLLLSISAALAAIITAIAVYIAAETPPTATIDVAPTTITEGQSATLTWDTSDATEVTLNGASVNPDDTLQVSPGAGTHVYTLVATGPGGQATDDATLIVDPAPPPMGGIETVQPGNWSAATTWEGGVVPTASDDVIVSHPVTIDQSVTIGETITVGANITQGNFAFTLNAGATLSFDTSAGDVKWIQGTANSQHDCYIVAAGTVANHVAINKTGSGSAWFDGIGEGSGANWDTTGWDLAYCDMTGIGKADGSFSIGLNTFGSLSLRLDHCTFNNCGTVFKPRPYAWSGGANKDYFVRDCRWLNTAAGVTPLNCQANGSIGTGAHEVVRNTFGSSAFFNAKIDLKRNLFEHTPTLAGGPLLSNEGNIYVRNGGDGDLTPNSSMVNCYWIAGLTHPGNPHCFNGMPDGTTVQGCIFEYPLATAIDSGECVYNSGGSAMVTVVSNLAVASETDGHAIGNMAHNSGSAAWTVDHNTVVGTNNAYMAFTEEGSDGPPRYGSIRSNIVASPSGATAAVVYDVFQAFTDLVTPANASHNGIFNPVNYADSVSGQTLVGYRSHFTAVPGANDVVGNPQLADSTRNFANWSVFKGAAQASDSLAVRFEATLSLLRSNPSLGETDLSPWVRAGHVPTNAAYLNAGHDGLNLGIAP